MKTTFTLLVATFFTVSAFAGRPSLANSDQKLNLDPTGTCETDFQKQISEKSLEWFKAYKAEDYKTQLALFADDFMIFHSALAALAMQVEGNPNVKLPFTSGPLTKKNYIETLALIAFTQDQRSPGDVPVSLKCVGTDTVVVTVAFDGLQTSRDAEGFITYQAPLVGQAIKTFVFDPQTLLIKRHYIDFDPAVSAKAKANIAQQIKDGVQPLLKDASTRKTYAEYLAQYRLSAGVPTPNAK